MTCVVVLFVTKCYKSCSGTRIDKSSYTGVLLNFNYILYRMFCAATKYIIMYSRVTIGQSHLQEPVQLASHILLLDTVLVSHHFTEFLDELQIHKPFIKLDCVTQTQTTRHIISIIYTYFCWTYRLGMDILRKTNARFKSFWFIKKKNIYFFYKIWLKLTSFKNNVFIWRWLS